MSGIARAAGAEAGTSGIARIGRASVFASRGLAVGVGLVAAPAWAGNGGHPRTPVEWPDDVPCMTVVDRSRSAVVHFPYGILYEDTELTPDELPTSRRHQFIAFCRDHSPHEPPPTWLSWTDVTTWTDWVMMSMLDQEPLLLGDEDVLETSSVYGDCFVRITADDARRPITFAEANKGVDWDTSGLPAGAYIVQGYTWEPAINIWSKRPGVVHVVDSPDPGASSPAAALTNDEAYVFAGQTLELRGCARAMPGATLSGFWTPVDGEPGWQPFVTGVPLEGDAIALAFTPPAAAIGQTIALRVDVTDPLARTFSAYPARLVEVWPATGGTTTTTGCEATCGASEPGEAASETGGAPTTGGTTAGASSGGAETSTGASEGPASPTGCGCRAEAAGSWGPALWVALARRRRRTGARGGAPTERAAVVRPA
ncbi:MAG TPA: hypothetical protein VIK91_25800 [Nannocystis sp.]